MTTETESAAPTDAEDTAAVLAIASGEKTYLPEPEPKAQAEEPKAETEEDLGDDAPAAAEPEAKAPEPKPKKSVQERIDELTRDKHEIARTKDQEIEFWKAKALQPGNAQPADKAQPDTPQGDGRPDPTKYDLGNLDAQYIEDLTDWKAEQAADRRFAQEANRRQASDAQATFQTRTATLFPDGPSEGLQAFLKQQTIPIAAVEIIASSDIGPKIAEHLGDNPAEVTRLMGMSPVAQARELTRLETRLSEPPKAIPKTATDAPEPPPQARGSGGQFKVAADTPNFADFEKQYSTGG